jgi:AraC-like DNA-binding protein
VLPLHTAREIAPLLRFCGHPELAAQVGFGPDVLDDPNAFVPLPRLHDLLEAAVAASGDAYLGLHFGALTPELTRGRQAPLLQLMWHSPDLRTSFERLLAHQRLWNPGEGYVLEEDGATARLRYVPWGPSRDGQRQMAEKTAAQFLVMLRLLVGVAPTAIRFAYPERGRANELARGLGIAPGFDAAATEIDFPAEALDGCVADSEPALFRALDRHMARVSSRADVPGSLTARVRAIVVGSLAGGLPSLPALAKRMGCGERTLQRGLAKEGTSLRTLVEEARRRRAESLVATDLTVAELAYQLGYGDAAAVQHALRRWFGANAGELRERERERPSGDRASDRNGEPAS